MCYILIHAYPDLNQVKLPFFTMKYFIMFIINYISYKQIGSSFRITKSLSHSADVKDVLTETIQIFLPLKLEIFQGKEILNQGHIIYLWSRSTSRCSRKYLNIDI